MDLKFNPGDQVSLKLAKKEIEGIILESHDSSVVLIKLDSGYNIGIPKTNILNYQVIKKSQIVEKKEAKLTTKKGLPTLGLVLTGGTIASKLDTKTGGVKPLTKIEEFARIYPDIFNKYNIKKLEIPFMLDSSAMSSSEWKKIAQTIEPMLDDKDIQGIIVTHGTDTLHYTAAALSFFIKPNKPIVLTYSQKSIDRASSDANFNLACAAKLATSNCAEVVLVGHSSMNDDFCYAMRGTKVRKMHSSRRDAFKAINSSPIAKVYPDNIEFLENYKASREAETDIEFNDKVALIKFYPGQSPEILDYHKEKGYKALVIEALGLGQLPASESENNWIPAIKKAISSGLVICASPQTLYGELNPKVYSPGRELESAGVIFLKDMLPETALVKLGWVLGHRSWRTTEQIKKKMLENFSGEFNDLLTD